MSHLKRINNDHVQQINPSSVIRKHHGARFESKANKINKITDITTFFLTATKIFGELRIFFLHSAEGCQSN